MSVQEFKRKFKKFLYFAFLIFAEIMDHFSIYILDSVVELCLENFQSKIQALCNTQPDAPDELYNHAPTIFIKDLFEYIIRRLDKIDHSFKYNEMILYAIFHKFLSCFPESKNIFLKTILEKEFHTEIAKHQIKFIKKYCKESEVKTILLSNAFYKFVRESTSNSIKWVYVSLFLKYLTEDGILNEAEFAKEFTNLSLTYIDQNHLHFDNESKIIGKINSIKDFENIN
jgi:hypothetical protein